MRRGTTIAVLLTLAGVRLAHAGGKTETLTPGWDGFPSLTSGSVQWSTNGNDFSVLYTLDGAFTNHASEAGMHHMDVTGPLVFGGATTSEGTVPDLITREGNTTSVLSTEFGFLTTDADGDASQGFVVTPNPGTYAVQFNLRDGGPPGCPVTNCSAVYRTGAPFAAHLTRFTIPGATSFWSGDQDATDEVGPNDLTTHGNESFAAGQFRNGFSLDGTTYLEAPSPVAGGLTATAGFTVSAWIVQDGFSSAASIVNLRTSANTSGFTLEPLFNTPGSMLFAVNAAGGANGFTFLEVPGFPAGESAWVAAEYDATTHALRVLRNGALVGQRADVTGDAMVLLGTEQFQIGRNIVNGPLFHGNIDEVGYWGSALPLDQLRAIGGWLFADGFEIGDTTAWSHVSL